MTSPIAPLLPYLRSVAEPFLAQTCSVQRYAETNTPDGIEQGWSDVATGVPCLVAYRQAAAAENVGEGTARGISRWSVWLPVGTDVTRLDRVAIDAPDGRVFEVQNVGVRTNEVLRLADCVLVD